SGIDRGRSSEPELVLDGGDCCTDRRNHTARLRRRLGLDFYILWRPPRVRTEREPRSSTNDDERHTETGRENHRSAPHPASLAAFLVRRFYLRRKGADSGFRNGIAPGRRSRARRTRVEFLDDLV